MRQIPSPRELGFPAKFAQWRPNQIEALRAMLDSPRRFKALDAPTGFGKTAVYVAYALITQRATCFITDSRALQDQLLLDFESVGLVDIRGRRNYDCGYRVDYTCEEGIAAKCPFRGTANCPESQATQRAAASPLVVTNYDKWTSARKYGQGMDHFQQAVLDEGHLAPEKLANAMQVLLSPREIEEIGLDLLSGTQAQEMVNWKSWAGMAKGVAEQAMLRARRKIQEAPSPRASWIQQYHHLRRLAKRLGTISTATPEHWIVDEEKEGRYQFDPIRPGRYAEAALFMGLESIVIVSATLRKKTLYQLGVGNDSFTALEFDSDFPVTRCPIYYLPTMRVDSRAGDLSRLWLLLDQIAARRTDRKGIVSTVSYARRESILGVSRHAGRMLINERGEPATSVVGDFRDATPGAILVSPSIGTGFDFPLKDCEWFFLCKIPFPHASKIVKARTEADPEYPHHLAMMQLEQNFGRGMRSKQDQCEGFIGDEHLNWFYPHFKHLASRSFRRRFQEVTTIPTPPPHL